MGRDRRTDEGGERADGFGDVSEAELRAAFDEQDYVASDEVVTTTLLALRLGKPLLVEGAPGGGKTELAKVLAAGFGAELVRLQCYEGLAAEQALYEWNYTKQLLAVESGEAGVGDDGENDDESDARQAGRADATRATRVPDDTPESDPESVEGDGSVFDEAYLLERPLLRALSAADDGDYPPVLLVDEVDRADEAFEALLLEVLSDFQVSIPELGTVEARRPPVVVLTSNRTRALSDALKRRCLYLHVRAPTPEREQAIVRRKVPALDDVVAAEVSDPDARDGAGTDRSDVEAGRVASLLGDPETDA